MSATLHGLLAAAAADHPRETAVVDGERELTYAQLDAESDTLAGVLAARGVAPGDRVALLLEKSVEAVSAIYAILKAGAVYVPLDDRAPTERLAYVLGDAGARVLISDASQAPRWPELRAAGASLETIVAAGDVQGGDGVIAWQELASAPARPLPATDDPEALAYILYTSGSTGEPKGVMLSHANGRAFVDWAAAEVGVCAQDRLSSHAPFHFDLSTFDLFAAAHAGAAVVLVPRSASVFPVALAGWIERERITVWYSVPSVLTLLVLRGNLTAPALPALRAIIFAGEVFATKHLAQLRELVPRARLLNFYGPTETNVCTWYEVPASGPVPDPLPIGYPLPGVSASIHDGELHITGPSVMHGYWGDRRRTEHALITGGDQRTYRTGDLVREAPDGALIFLGRRDAQIKTRGYRVELGEIEAALNAVPEVIECAVLAVPDEVITNRLVAYVSSHGELSAQDLVTAARRRLPPYMIPDEFEFMPELPKSATGKVDRLHLQRKTTR